MGPGAMIYLRQPLSRAQLRELWDIIERTSERTFESRFYNLEFALSDVQELGGRRFDESGSFGLLISARSADFEPEAPIAIQQNFGFTPQQILQLDSMCNFYDDHIILGTVLSYFAEMYDGMVNFCGALTPPMPEEIYAETDWKWADIAPYFDEMAKTLAGRVVSVRYEVDRGGTWVYHLADAAFMKAWLHHPNFHLIK